MIQKPKLFNEGTYTQNDLEKFIKSSRIESKVDIFDSQLEELFEITHPHLVNSSRYDEEKKQFLIKRNNDTNSTGTWVYYSWLNTLIHIVNRDELYQLRTNRNRNLITTEEQEKLLDSRIGVAGLSIGNSILMSLLHGGIGNKYILAEKDILTTANLNRIRMSLMKIGNKKIELTIRQMYELDPYLEIDAYADGLTQKNVKDFISIDGHKLSVIFDAIDDFEMKVRIRVEARNAGVPVVMVTSLGDNVLLDIERYDLHPELPLFNGLVGNTIDQILQKRVSENDKKKFAVALVGRENVPKRAIESVQEIGISLIGRPQLMNTVTVASGIASYVARKIILGEYTNSGRRLIKFDQTFLPASNV